MQTWDVSYHLILLIGLPDDSRETLCFTGVLFYSRTLIFQAASGALSEVYRRFDPRPKSSLNQARGPEKHCKLSQIHADI